MKKLLGIIEDDDGNVLGAVTSAGEIRLAPEERVPRAKLREVAVTLATKYGIDPASFTLPAPQPAPEETDSTPQGAD